MKGASSADDHVLPVSRYALGRFSFLKDRLPSVNDDAIRSRALYLLAALLIFSPLLEGGTTHIAVMTIRLIILTTASICILALFREEAPRRPRMAIDAPVLAFLSWSFISTILSPTAHQSRQWLVVLCLYALMLYLVVFLVRRWKDVIWLISVVVLMGIGESTWALIQYSNFDVPRPSGTFFNPNFLAGYLAAVFVLVLSLGIHAGFRSRPYRKRPADHLGLIETIAAVAHPYRATAGWFVVWGGIVAILFAGVIVTGSRGGLVALVIGTMFVIGLRYRLRGVGLLIIAIGGLLIIPNPARSRIQLEHATNPVTYARWHMWQEAAHLIVENPLGVGLGLYQYVYPRRAVPVEGAIARYGKVAQTAHNEYVQIGVELGVVGLACFCWGLIRMGAELKRVVQFRLKRWHRGFVVGIGGCMTTILVHAAMDSNLHEPGVAVLVTLAIGLLCSVRYLASPQNEYRRPLTVWPRFAWVTGGILVLSMVGMTVLQTGIAWLYFEDGVRVQREGNLAEATEEYQTAVWLDPDKALYHSSLAAVHFQAFRQTLQRNAAQAALDEIEQGIAHNPIDGRLRALRGLVSTSLAQSLPSGPEFASKRYALVSQAIQSYEEAHELEPFSPFHLLELGRLYWAIGGRQTAIQKVQHAVEMEPNFLPGREWLARAYLSLGSLADQERATHEIDQILERQRRYASVPKDPLELTYLSVDLSNLKPEPESSHERIS